MSDARKDLETTNVLLLGKTGHGKTATAASIIGHHNMRLKYHNDQTASAQFDQATNGEIRALPHRETNRGHSHTYESRTSPLVQMGLSSDNATTDVSLVGSVLMDDNNGRIHLLDSPGLFDTRNMDKVQATLSAIKNIEIAIEISMTGINAFAIVMRYAARYTEEEQELVNNLETIFGSEFFKDHVFLIFTHGDDYNYKSRGAPFSEWVKRQTGELGKLISKCQRRCLLFENERGTAEINSYQNKELFKTLYTMDSKFTMKDFEKTKQGRDQLLKQAHIAKRVTEFRNRRDKIMDDFNRAQREHGRKRDELMSQLNRDVQKLQADADPDDIASWQREMQEIEKVVSRITAGGRR